MRQLINEHSAPANFAKFPDHYHEALRELVNAKQAHRKPRMPKSAKPTAKVVNFMDALQKEFAQTRDCRIDRASPPAIGLTSHGLPQACQVPRQA